MNVINLQVLPLIKAEYFACIEMFHVRAAQRALFHVMVTQMLCCLYSEHQSVSQSFSWWVSHSSGNVGCQWTVNSMQLKLPFSAL
jgi:hypothetical protein